MDIYIYIYYTHINIIQSFIIQYQNIFFANNLKTKIDHRLYLKKKLFKIKSFTIYFKLIKINKEEAKWR